MKVKGYRFHIPRITRLGLLISEVIGTYTIIVHGLNSEVERSIFYFSCPISTLPNYEVECSWCTLGIWAEELSPMCDYVSFANNACLVGFIVRHFKNIAS